MLEMPTPAAEVRPAEGAHDMQALADRINAEHEAGQGQAAGAVAHYRAAGELLLRARAGCEHGEWIPWLAANVSFSRRHAWRYMELAKCDIEMSHLDELQDAWAEICGQSKAAIEQEDRDELDRILNSGKPLTPEERSFVNRVQGKGKASGATHNTHRPPIERLEEWFERGADMIGREKYRLAMRPDVFAVRVAERLVLPHLPAVVAERVRAVLQEAKEHGTD